MMESNGMEHTRLSRAEARTLAAAKGLNIPGRQDYSLVEIYNDCEDDTAHRADQIGFCK
jgi:hypothetical protein